jgi:hypothetical protein
MERGQQRAAQKGLGQKGRGAARCRLVAHRQRIVRGDQDHRRMWPAMVQRVQQLQPRHPLQLQVGDDAGCAADRAAGEQRFGRGVADQRDARGVQQ